MRGSFYFAVRPLNDLVDLSAVERAMFDQCLSVSAMTTVR
jgi:hypothetical protein